MLTEGPSRGGRNCSWSSVHCAREYGLKFAGGISMNGNMVEYITAHAQSRTPAELEAALDHLQSFPALGGLRRETRACCCQWYIGRLAALGRVNCYSWRTPPRCCRRGRDRRCDTE